MAMLKKPDIELSYAKSLTLHAEDYLKFVAGNTSLFPTADALKFHFYETSSEPTIARNAREVIIEALKESQVLPREPSTTIDLMYCCSPAEISSRNARGQIELLKEEVDFLSFFKDGELIQNPATCGNPIFEDLQEKGLIKTKYVRFGNPRYGDNISASVIRFVNTDTSSLKSKVENLQNSITIQEIQSEKIFEALEKTPKAEVYIHETRFRDSYDIKEGGIRRLSIFNIPKPVADWLPQIWNNKEEGNVAAETEKAAIPEIAYLIKQKWEPSYSKEESKKSFSREDFKENPLIDEFTMSSGKRGVLFGIESSGETHENSLRYNLGQINFEEVRRHLKQKISESAAELRKKEELIAR